MKNILYKLWLHSPLSWAIIRANECKLITEIKFNRPVLEIGCGDGLFMQTVVNNKQRSVDMGIDIDVNELKRAEKTGIYKKLMSVDITHAPFKNGAYDTIIANGVLEHIPDLPAALKEIRRILKRNGQFITTSPTDNYGKILFYTRFLKFIGLIHLAEIYEDYINKIFAHVHLFDHKKWQILLRQNGLNLEKYIYYNNQNIVLIHDIFLPFSLFTKYVKNKTDSMVLFPKLHEIIVRIFLPLIFNICKYNSEKYHKNASVLLICKKN